MALQLNLETFLAPIPGSHPSGENLRYTTVYDQIKEARRADDQLDRGEWRIELKRSDWELAIKLCSDALAHKSKDLQIAVWLTEALLHKYGFSGLGFGLELICELMTHYWGTLYPEIEDDDFDYRIGPLTYLNEKLPTIVNQVPLSEPDRAKVYNYFDWEESRIVGAEGSLDKRQKKDRRQSDDEGKVSSEAINTAVNLSSLKFYKQLHDQLIECCNRLKTLDIIATQKFINDPPGFTRLNDTLMAYLRIVKKIYTEKTKSEVAEIEDEDLQPDPKDNIQDVMSKENAHNAETTNSVDLFIQKNAITDISIEEKTIWKMVTGKAGNGHLKDALDQLMASAALAPSERQKNRYLLLVAKLCINAGRHDLAMPVVEALYLLIETLNLEKWEHPAWISEVVEGLYQCLDNMDQGSSDRAKQLFKKLCTLNITKAAKFRIS